MFFKLLYGESHLAGQVLGGTVEQVGRVTLEDVKQWYAKNFSPQMATFNVAGAIDANTVKIALHALDQNWQSQDVKFPLISTPKPKHKSKIYFIDFPDAKQSVLMVGKVAVPATHQDFNRINIVNNRLGAGSSARLTQTLRISKGYTYGAFSFLQSRRDYPGAFVASTQVRSNVTLESLQILQELIGDYANTFEQVDLDVTKNLMKKSSTRRFETLQQLLGEVQRYSLNDLPDNYLEVEQAQLADMTLLEAKTLINTHIDESKMIYLVVGDAKTQLERVSELGYGEPILLDKAGKPIE